VGNFIVDKCVVCGIVVLASSGIDYDIKLWMPTNDYPQFDEAAANEVNSFSEMLHAPVDVTC